jgi:hypothetical protein
VLVQAGLGDDASSLHCHRHLPTDFFIAILVVQKENNGNGSATPV